jgi:hypothetical protein
VVKPTFNIDSGKGSRDVPTANSEDANQDVDDVDDEIHPEDQGNAYQEENEQE